MRSLPALTPLAAAVLLAVVVAAPASAQSGASWFAGSAQTARGQARGPSPTAALQDTVRRQQEVGQALSRSFTNLGTTAAAIAAQQAMQERARATAMMQTSRIPDGLADGGLKLADGAADNALDPKVIQNASLWRGARLPVAARGADGRIIVNIEQTESRAILNWDSFNVGRNTTVNFDQRGGSADGGASSPSSWAVLNKVVGAQARPSEILGAINAQGTVMVVNQNGVIFSGSSQINTRNLVAAAARTDAALDTQFLNNGLYSTSSTAPSLITAAESAGVVRVDAGARIATLAPQSATQGGGYVLLAGREVSNAGQISTPNGQVTLAAGDSFVIARGQGTDSNTASTTRGNEVRPVFAAGSQAGKVSNSGLIQSSTGDITLTGNELDQNGVLLSSTSVSARGTVHLKAVDSPAPAGSITLGGTTAILVDQSAATALDSQRTALMGPVDTSNKADYVAVTDRRDLSLVDISSSGTVDFQDKSLTLATGGQITVAAAKRTLLRDGAALDVAGATGVAVAMESNSIKINVQGNEQRDANVNRDAGKLNSSDVWVDVRDLVFVPAGTNGYASDRWYTKGGLLEVGGYLGTRTRSAGEWLAQGGTVSFSGKDVVTQAGSSINLSGGTLDVQDGYLRQTWLRGADGKLYEVSSAPGDILYTGLYKGYEQHSDRWGQTSYYYSPLIAPTRRYEAGYTIGRDAGRLVVSTSNAVLEGQLVSDVYQGSRQTQAAQSGVDGFMQAQNAVARRAELVVGTYTPYFVQKDGRLIYNLGSNANTLQEVVFGDVGESVAGGLGLGLGLDGSLPEDRQGRLLLDSAQLSATGLGALRVAAGDIVVDRALQTADGGAITLVGPRVAVNAGLTARSGSIALGNVLEQISGSGRVEDVPFEPAAGDPAWLQLASGVTLDASGLSGPGNVGGEDGRRLLPYINGGQISLRSNRNVDIAAGSVIDVSSGAQWLDQGSSKARAQGGRGGNVTLAANVWNGDGSGQLNLGGTVRGYGVEGGGTLRVESGRIVIAAQDAADGAMTWKPGDFNLGFANYNLIGHQSLTVASDAQIAPVMPLLRDAQGGLPTAPAVLAPWLPPVMADNFSSSSLSARKGANLTLQAGNTLSTFAQRENIVLDVQQGARIAVDPGRTIALASAGSLTMNGALQASGGNILITTVATASDGEPLLDPRLHERTLHIGSTALLDVSGQAWSAVGAAGLRYGRADSGGRIVIGAELDDARDQVIAPDALVVVDSGAQLLANGASTVIDLPGGKAVTVAGAGGTIAFASANGMLLNGSMQAQSGGAGAAGGHLKLALEAPRYLNDTTDNALRTPREIILGHGDSDAGLQRGTLRFNVDRIAASGFDSASILAASFISFDGDVSLNLGRSINLYSRALGLADGARPDAHIALAAPYVRLAGAAYGPTGEFNVRPVLNDGTSGLENTSERSDATFEVKASLLDIRDRLVLGATGSMKQSNFGTVNYSRRGFASVDLYSAGDIRFVSPASITPEGSGGQWGTRLVSASDINLVAAQIYPTTGATALIKTASDGKITIGRSTAGTPGMPDSAFGSLTLEAAEIEQGGVLRAPLGRLVLGTTVGQAGQVSLLDGSITSVSGNGLIMPYGGTTDGLSYEYDGKTVKLMGAGGNDSGNTLEVGLNIGAAGLTVESGAVVDLSGGGSLLGAGFISGRGGSTDVRYSPLVRYGDAGFSLPDLAEHPIYAIVPGVQKVGPVTPEQGASQALIGQQITIGAGVPGLPAGTYTLLPSTYALMPGAFRVELDGAPTAFARNQAMALRGGSYASSGKLSIANTAIADALARPILLTPANVVRQLSQYKEMSYAEFAQADAALKGVPRAMVEADARTLLLNLSSKGTPEETLSLDGQFNFKPAEGGLGGTVAIKGGANTLEIVADGKGATAGFVGTSLNDADLNRLNAPRLVFGSMPYVQYGQGGNTVKFDSSNLNNITLRDGATLRAGEVIMASAVKNGAITIEAGASINTVGAGPAPYDSRAGYIYDPGTNGLLIVSNGWLDVLAPTSTNPFDFAGPARILIGACASTACTGGAKLYSEGTLTVATDNTFDLSEASRFGARKLALAVGAINVGSNAALEAAAGQGLLPSGLTLNQSVLERLLNGDPAEGVPALEELSLTARDAIAFYGDVTLSTLDANGKSVLERLVLGSPALYGAGSQGQTARIQTGELYWLGNSLAPAAPITGGAGNGQGSLSIEVERLILGVGPNSRPTTQVSSDRLALGFADVSVLASKEITANGKGTLSVYERRIGFVEGQGHTYEGGRLNLSAPLWTGESGSISTVRTGALSYTGMDGAAELSGRDVPLGAELTLEGQRVQLNGLLRLASGKLAVRADEDVVLESGATIDLAGRVIDYHDVTRASGGGDLILESRNGNISQHASSVVDLSASGNSAGSLTAIALGENAGRVDLQGQILGRAEGSYDAGGTMLPHQSGRVEIRAQDLGDFAALNSRLTRDEVFGARSFQLKRGDLTVGDEVRANQVDISVDNGSLLVNGRIDASGERVGSIRLAAGKNLTLAQTAVLDAHGSLLRVDSYGGIIDSPNRAIVELASRDGVLTLQEGARIDLRHGTADSSGRHDGRQRGTLTLNAPRLGGATAGDIAINASGAIDIQGAREIAVIGNTRYTDATPAEGVNAAGNPYHTIDQAWLDAKHLDSLAFINNALANTALMQDKLAGLNNSKYRDAFHLRPGVEVAVDGDLAVIGDVDLSAYRYASVNPLTQKTPVYGSGDAGSLVLRASGNLDLMGSMTDGFAPPDWAVGETRNDGKGWVLIPGIQPFSNDVVIPRSGVTLGAGTSYLEGQVLNYAVPYNGFVLQAGVEIPGEASLGVSLTLPAGTRLQADIRASDGSLLFAAGTLLQQAATLPEGTRLAAGSRLPADVTLANGVWPAGAPLPFGGLVQSAELELKVGARIPAGVDVKFPEGTFSVDLRPVDSATGQQGRNWALGTLLPEGTQSWSMRLVAGADLGAADSRRLRTDADTSALRLADAHYIGSRSIVPAETIREYIWSDETAVAVPGEPVDADSLFFCEVLPSWCILVSETERPEYPLITPTTQLFSVLRTGTGDLELLSGGDVRMDSLYGVYTAGAQSAALTVDGRDPYQLARGNFQAGNSVLGYAGADYEALTRTIADGGSYAAWYPENGGNLLLAADGNVMGNVQSAKDNEFNSTRSQRTSHAVGNWSWRQGTGVRSDGFEEQATAWWINFGSYGLAASQNEAEPYLLGFTGIGTLGGGNLDVRVGGNAGTQNGYQLLVGVAERSQALTLAIGSTGRVTADGRVVQTGGGDLTLRVGGAINSSAIANDQSTRQPDLTGAITNLRGELSVRAGSIGTIAQSYGSYSANHSASESRAYQPYTATQALAEGGLLMTPGDAVVRVDTRGDLVLMAVGDPGRGTAVNSQAFADRTGAFTAGGGLSNFSLWTPHTAVDLLSVGGNLTPIQSGLQALAMNLPVGDGVFTYPSILRASAMQGSMYYGSASTGRSGAASSKSLVLAPSANGVLEMIAGDSIYAGDYLVTRSGTDPANVATPFKPAFAGYLRQISQPLYDNYSEQTRPGLSELPLFAFGPDLYDAQASAANHNPLRFYAMDGDILGLRTGQIVTYTERVLYQGGGALRVMAGRDIVNAGTGLGAGTAAASGIIRGLANGVSTGNLIIHANDDDISVIQAGRDIRLSSFQVAGPGHLSLEAGRNVYASGPGAGNVYREVNVSSLGSVDAAVPVARGASISILASAGQGGADYAGLLARYLDPANRLAAGATLADTPNGVVESYEGRLTLAQWLRQEHGFGGNDDQAQAYLTQIQAQRDADSNQPRRNYADDYKLASQAYLLNWLQARGYTGSDADAKDFLFAMAPEQQAMYAREIYFKELREGGREYNNPDSPRLGSYLRGRLAIASLFPATDATGAARVYEGGVTMYGGAGIRTYAGGDIQVLTPGGQQIYGVEGAAPPASAGVLTQGAGNIQMYAADSILLGQSRIMTTFGGHIQAWSAGGDINAGRGSRTTVVYTPPRRSYDAFGNVTVSPVVPSTGAGIATLAPIAEVPAGDIDLIAPLGTIDAGEAGIRVSGNVNIAALQVVNAANIQVQGDSAGIPAVASVNVGALTSASAAASNAASSAQEAVQRARADQRRNQSSVFNVQILGFGDGNAAPAAPRSEPLSYNPGGSMQVVGLGTLNAAQTARLTPEEVARLQQ